MSTTNYISCSDNVTVHPQCAALLALSTANQHFLFSVPSDDGKRALHTHMTTSKNVRCRIGVVIKSESSQGLETLSLENQENLVYTRYIPGIWPYVFIFLVYTRCIHSSYLVYTWCIPGIWSWISIYLVYTWYIPCPWPCQWYERYIPLRRQTSMDLFRTSHVSPLPWYIPVIC